MPTSVLIQVIIFKTTPSPGQIKVTQLDSTKLPLVDDMN